MNYTTELHVNIKILMNISFLFGSRIGTSTEVLAGGTINNQPGMNMGLVHKMTGTSW